MMTPLKNDGVDEVLVQTGTENGKSKKLKRANSYATVTKAPIPFYSFKSIRLRICLLSMMGLFMSASMKVSLNMAVVCMVNSTAFQVIPQQSAALNSSVALSEKMGNPKCSRITFQEEESKGYHGTFLWTSTEVSWLLSAAFYGGLITVSYAGILADKFSPKLLMLLAVFDSMVVSFLTPLLANMNVWALFVARFIRGAGDGLIFPCMTSLMARWIPKNERSTSAALTTSGNQIATIFGLWFSALLCGTDLLGGWPLIFYFFATLAAIWCIFWMTSVTNSPADYKNISKEEAAYLREQLESQISQKSGSNKLYSSPIPWFKIFTSVPVICNILAQFVYTFSMVLLQTYLPTFMKQVLRLELSKNGFFAMLPFLVQLVTKNLVAMLSDYLKRKGYVSNTAGCKIFQVISNVGSAFCYVILAYFVDCSSLLLTMGTLLLYGALFSTGVCGYFTSQLSVAPQYSGLLGSIARLASIIGGAISINFVGYINQHGTLEEWRVIWMTAAAINVVMAVIYVLFASADIQPWARISSTDPASTKTDLEQNLILEFESEKSGDLKKLDQV